MKPIEMCSIDQWLAGTVKEAQQLLNFGETSVDTGYSNERGLRFQPATIDRHYYSDLHGLNS